MKIPVYYISIEGNTRHFVKQMSRSFGNVQLHEISEQSDLFTIRHEYFAFVPTYVKGIRFDVDDSSGLSNNIEEINTLAMNDELAYHRNYRRCLGLIGSGNRNFGIDCYCWTARHYHKKYKIPLIADYEIRGTFQDENAINHKMIKIWNRSTRDHLPFHERKKLSPRLIHLERKYGKDLLGKDL